MSGPARGRVFIATSLDGFIARPDGALDWLERPGAEGDNGYAAFMDSVDGLLMGRSTFQTVLGFDVPWPYEKPVVVLSRSLTAADIPAALDGKVRIWATTPGEALARLGAEGWGHAYVDGGALIRSCLEAGLIDEMTLFRMPVLIGQGIPLFGPLPGDIDLDLVSVQARPGGIVETRYRIGTGGR